MSELAKYPPVDSEFYLPSDTEWLAFYGDSSHAMTLKYGVLVRVLPPDMVFDTVGDEFVACYIADWADPGDCYDGPAFAVTAEQWAGADPVCETAHDWANRRAKDARQVARG